MTYQLNNTVRALMNPQVLKSDAQRVVNCIYGTQRDPVNYTQAIIDTLGALVTETEANAMVQKARVHTVRMGRWIASQGLDFGKFDRATAFCAAVIANTSAPRVCYADLHYVCGGRGENTSPIGGVSRAKLQAIIGRYTNNMGTISAQCARTVGKHGIFTGLNVTNKTDVHGFAVTPEGRNHPFLIALAVTLNGLSDRTIIDLMQGEDD